MSVGSENKGEEMKSTVIKDINGAVINIGPWDYKLVDGVAGNPLPEGAYVSEEEVVESADGGKYAASNHVGLRRAEYPPIGDQLDALFRAGLFPPDMAAQLAAVKAKWPKL